MSGRVLLADVGGTNARFTLLENGRLGSITSINVVDHPRFDQALAAFLGGDEGQTTISGALLAVAGPVESDRAAITNSGWVIDAVELRSMLGIAQIRLINDFAAIAWSLPHLSAADLLALGTGARVPEAPAVVLGPGTGLGLACFLPRADGAIVLGTEGGHATLPAVSPRDDAVISHLRRRFGHVSAERVISGPGLVNLYEALAAIEQCDAPPRSGSEITNAALNGTCAICREALSLFCAMLGTVAGNAALSFGARGGIYIGGGIAPRIASFLATSQFRTRFDAKGRFQSYMQSIPASVIMHPAPAFLGMQALAAQTFV
jgi:glucokinase